MMQGSTTRRDIVIDSREVNSGRIGTQGMSSRNDTRFWLDECVYCVMSGFSESSKTRS